MLRDKLIKGLTTLSKKMSGSAFEKLLMNRPGATTDTTTTITTTTLTTTTITTTTITTTTITTTTITTTTTTRGLKV